MAATTKIRGEHRPVNKIFGDDFILQIPPYQRPYSWGTEEAGELFDDLLHVVSNDGCNIDDLPPYFLGSIVLIKEEGDPKSDVVDGQQRLTTLTILLSVLRDHVPKKHADSLEKRIKEDDDPFTRTEGRMRLTIRDRDQEFFQRYIQEEVNIEALRNLNPATLSDPQTRIRDNALLYNSQLGELPEDMCFRLGSFVLTQCYLVVVIKSTIVCKAVFC